MLSRWRPPQMSSGLVPGGHGGWPLARRMAHSRSSGVRWSREAEISRYKQLKRAALDMASDGDRVKYKKKLQCKITVKVFVICA